MGLLAMVFTANSQTSLDYYADHAQDVAIGVRINVTIVSETPVAVDVPGLSSIVDKINVLYNGNAFQSLGGLTGTAQQIPANVNFILNSAVNVVDPANHDMGELPIYDHAGVWYLNHFYDDNDSIVDIIFLDNSQESATYAYGHPGKGIIVSNGTQTEDMYVHIAPAMGRVFALLNTFGGPECTGDFGEDYIPDTPVENCDCMGTLWAYCSNNIMANSPQKEYFSRHQVGFIRRSLLIDMVCYWETDSTTGEVDTICFLLPSADLSVKQFAFYGEPVHLGVDESKASDMEIYPNPATDHFVYSGGKAGRLRVIDMSGKTVYRDEKYTGTSVYAGLKPGIYFVEYLGVTKKLVISHR